ncbi:hypothetical protein UMM65_06575 [Aureibaculum sp. 2210JD6-5]|uniref:DUF5074 domain-containing protein n=1 Tax=Aureibaculum sp. 2210JD6-5 TaxID=3103957 RepID=UPI002AAE6BEA|nr:hypothetical protein [Aureibaculum sp. 2210JD6-5]MDY7394900.1 hypothetical protein [Aureibaculum sp. 2210JD6-5]
MKKPTLFTAIVFAFIIASCSSDSDNPKIIETYDNTFILTFESDKTSLGHLDTAFAFTPDVYTSVNGNASSMYNDNESIYIVNRKGPNFISQLNIETLSEESIVSNSDIDNPGNLLMYSEDEGLIVGSTGRGRRKKYQLGHVNINTGISAPIETISTKMLPSNSALLLDNNNVLIADGKTLKAMDIVSKKITALQEFKEHISGIIKDADGFIWVATEKRTEKASFIKLNFDYSIAENITITNDNVNLYTNSLLTMSKNSYNAYWSESSSGIIYRFNTKSKTIEKFSTPMLNDVLLTTLVKEHPLTKKVYVLGLEDFLDTEKSVLVIYNEDKTRSKLIKNVGNSPIDIIFSDKEYIGKQP